MTIFRSGLVLIILSCAQPAVAEDLIAIYRQAVEADPQSKSADVKVEIGSAQKNQALGQMLPQVNATGNWSKNRSTVNGKVLDTITNYPGTRYYLSLNQTLISKRQISHHSTL